MTFSWTLARPKIEDGLMALQCERCNNVIGTLPGIAVPTVEEGDISFHLRKRTEMTWINPRLAERAVYSWQAVIVACVFAWRSRDPSTWRMRPATAGLNKSQQKH
jgi:hypothetical protein